MTIKVNNQEFKVIRSWTPEDFEANGFPKTAEKMRNNHVARDIYATKPKGQRVFCITEYVPGYEQWSIPLMVPFSKPSDLTG